MALGQLQPAAAPGKRGILAAQDRQEAAGDLGPGRFRIAPDQQRSWFRGSLRVGQRVDHGILGRLGFLQPVQLGPQARSASSASRPGADFSTWFLGTFSLSRSASDLRKPLISCVFFRIASWASS